MSDNRGIVYVEESGLVVYRASSLGNCIRSLVLARRGVQPDEGGHSKQQELAMREGNLHEEDVVNQLEAQGCGVFDQQLEVQWFVPGLDRVVVRGHLDGLLGEDILEIKSMSKDVFRQWIQHRWDAQPGYAMQVSAYMLALGRKAVLVAKDRNAGTIDKFYIDEPPVSEAVLTERIATVEWWAAPHRTKSGGGLPPCEPEQAWKCSFQSYHDDYSEPQKAIDLDDATLDKLCDAYRTAADEEKAYGAKREELRQEILSRLGDQAGEITVQTPAHVVQIRHVTRKQVDFKGVRKAFDLKPFEKEEVSATLLVKERKK